MTAEFIRITNAGLVESHPHDINITEGSAELHARRHVISHHFNQSPDDTKPSGFCLLH